MVISMAGRRSRAAMKALKEEMRKLEGEGKSRAEISEILRCTKAQVTRALGAERQYRGKRLTLPYVPKPVFKPYEGGELDAKTRANVRSYANTYQRRGLLTPQPCEKCGALVAEKHHPDYSQPLQVVWLCRTCHKAEHVETAQG